MNIISEFLSNLFIILALNSFIVFIDNSIESNEIKDSENENKMVLSSIFFSFLFFIFDIAIILIIKKEKVLIEILLIIIFMFILFIIKQKRFKKVLKMNHILFDLIIFFRPFLWYYIYKIIFY
jgi:hypothetical protein